ncbi:putative lipoprotein [Amycolatopsis azurea DSM 43854]|nr:putative lipoprotein [Amycolatopsis azurea DSM 43854]
MMSHRSIRTNVTRVAKVVAACAGVLAVVACNNSGTPSAAPQSSASAGGGGVETSAAPTATSAATGAPVPQGGQAGTPKPSTAGKPVGSGNNPRCATTDLSLVLGAPKPSPNSPTQLDVPLTYKNKSPRTCALYGVPGADLNGPADPNGPVYHLTRVDNGVKYNDVPAGSTATATITVLKPAAGEPTWTPTQVTTIPPGQTQALTANWPSDLPVLRQDAATHPGTYVNGILSDPA